MLKIKKNKDEIIINASAENWIVAVVCFILSCIAAYELFDLSNLKDEHIFSYYLSVIALPAIICCASSLCLYFIKQATAQIIIDGQGVGYKDLFVKRAYTWSQVGDFGLSYSGYGKFGNRYYVLYFSDTEQLKKDKRKKRLRGKIIKLAVSDSDCSGIIRTVIPFCRKNIALIPFVPSELLK